mmetsp:Transcript_465/g.1180  ORF Transcript_465/g.1180 Transcript_465/m.1180 type:complete len:620 (+) Transcript_465:94-1953(+)
MADCSATGTTIDRAAAAITGNNGSNVAAAAKHVGSLFGHAAATTLAPPVSSGIGNNGMVIQAAAPQSISVPLSTSMDASSSLHVPRHQPVVPPQPIHHDRVQRHNASPDAMMSTPGAMALNIHYHRQQNHRQQQIQLQHQHQHQQHFMMMQQHQHQQAMAMMMMQQQQQQTMVARQQQQQQLKQSNNKASKIIDRGLVQDDLHDGKVEEAVQSAFGHQGLVQGAGMEELAAAWAQAEAESQDEYGKIGETENTIDQGVRGASMEQLAAAWAQAEAEYQDEYGQREFQEVNKDTSHLAGDVQSPYASLDHHHLAQYEFINAVQSDADTTSGSMSANFMEKGMEAFREGRVLESIRCFEMELQTQNRNNAAAWKMLGKAHAESDQDQKAILCLEEAVKIDPYAPDSILALAVSYLNELNHERALSCMKEFLTHNPKYAGVEEIMAAIDGSGVSSSGERHAFDEVKSMLLAALHYDPNDAADIHEALGVLYNVSKEYELATESFREALKMRENKNYSLWNRLGATLANFGKSDEALGCYTNSLRIKPKYARAWLNMGISYSNLGDFDEASRCYLQTLALNPDATHCWTYLRMSLSSNEKWDLLPYVFSRDLNSFQDHFDFVL